MAFSKTPLFWGKILSGASAADATGIGVMPATLAGQELEATVYVVFDHTSAAGTILLESSHSYQYSGTWATEATVTWAAIDSVKVAHLTAANQALRVRVSSAVTSGTCDVWLLLLPTS